MTYYPTKYSPRLPDLVPSFRSRGIYVLQRYSLDTIKDFPRPIRKMVKLNEQWAV